MTLMPRSCPSSPTFAVRMRMPLWPVGMSRAILLTCGETGPRSREKRVRDAAEPGGDRVDALPRRDRGQPARVAALQAVARTREGAGERARRGDVAGGARGRVDHLGDRLGAVEGGDGELKAGAGVGRRGGRLRPPERAQPDVQ